MFIQPSSKKAPILIMIISVLLISGISVLVWSKYFRNMDPKPVKEVFCTTEAKQCSDGSYVGRTGPNCEFEQCPVGNTSATSSLPEGYTLDSFKVEEISGVSCTKDTECETPGEYLVQSRCPFTSVCLQNKCTVVCPAYIDKQWKTKIDSATGVSFQYPEKLPTEYVTTAEWPPEIKVLKQDFSCGTSGENAKKLIHDRTYCISQESEGAAGSTYTRYAYAFAKDYPTNTPDATKAGSKTVMFTFSLQFPQCTNYDEPRKTACKDEQESFSVDEIVERMVQTLQMGFAEA